MTPKRRAEAALLLVALAWGVTFPLIKIALAHAAPFAFMALRFPLALLILWPLLRLRTPSRSSVLPGLVLSLLLGASYVAQVLGLEHTTPTRSAFITGLSVLLVPLLYPALTRRRPGRWPVAGAGVAAVGLYLMTAPGTGGFNRGDGLTLITAAAYALYIIQLEVFTRRYPYQDLLVMQFVPLAVLFAPPALARGAPIDWAPGLVWALVLTGPVLAVTVYLQNRWQRYTTATSAAVIFTGEPVFAAGFSFLLLGETLGPGQVAGCGLIVLGILASIRGPSNAKLRSVD